MTADVSDPARAAHAAAGASVIYHCASPVYPMARAVPGADTLQSLDATESSGAKLVFADNLYAYGPVARAIARGRPCCPRGRKGRTGVEMAAQLLAAHRNGQARVVIGRASDYYDHGTGSTAGETVFGRILAEKPAMNRTSTTGTPSTTCLTSPADFWFSLTGGKPDGQVSLQRLRR